MLEPYLWEQLSQPQQLGAGAGLTLTDLISVLSYASFELLPLADLRDLFYFIESGRGHTLSSAWVREFTSALGIVLEPALQLAGLEKEYASWALLMESVDFLLIFAELTLVTMLFVSCQSAFLQLQRLSNSRQVTTLCQRLNLSAVEFLALTALTTSFVLFDLLAAFSEEDAAETFGFSFVVLIFLITVIAACFANVHYYYMLSSVGSSDVTLRVLYADLVNNGLCLLRIFFCWVRYVFYDLQSEVIDFTTHYTEPSLAYN
jgi:hypothetical protein